MSFIDILFPKKCVGCKYLGSYLCDVCFSYLSFIEHNTCVVCQRKAMFGLTHPACSSSVTIDGVFSSIVYAGVVKKLIHGFKYPPYLAALADTMTDLFYEGIIQKEVFMTQLHPDTVLVPIPLHRQKLRRRGYNQSFLLAKGLSKQFSLSSNDCLLRVKNTKTQVTLSQSEREANIKGAFHLKETFSLKKTQQIILVDDVVTSGATLKEAAKVFKKAGVAKVWGITLAHGE